MPAHDPVKKDKEFEMHVLVVEKDYMGKIPDGHIQVKFEWHGGDRTWRIEGVQEPQSPFDNPKHNWQVFETNLPKGQGEAILSLLDWVKSLTSDV